LELIKLGKINCKRLAKSSSTYCTVARSAKFLFITNLQGTDT